MTHTNVIGHRVFGEQGSGLLPACLLVLGLALGALDLQWALGNHHQGLVKSASGANADLAPRPTPTITPLPSRLEAEPRTAPGQAEPGVKPAEKATVTSLERDCPPLFAVTFTLSSAFPRFDQTALDGLVRWLKLHPDANLVVDGHSDSLGSSAVNLDLSQRRAQQMVKRFLAAGFPRSRITRRAFGNYIPVIGARENGAENRRVALSVTAVKDCPQLESQ